MNAVSGLLICSIFFKSLLHGSICGLVFSQWGKQIFSL